MLTSHLFFILIAIPGLMTLYSVFELTFAFYVLFAVQSTLCLLMTLIFGLHVLDYTAV